MGTTSGHWGEAKMDRAQKDKRKRKITYPQGRNIDADADF